ncbi:flotillin-like FloA family protein [Thalassoroseus pseudoceratinae]|uniref:flotillin-like FloA family protein n=1 Tax=Thalassoroseus pseudoceratinae TaxID=2713176 RepID=UPI001421CBC6|nr:flotillin-like FloA family protein [Thalassoroseus pseudoceratinae]
MDPVFIAILVGVLFLFASFFVFVLGLFRPWLQAFLAGVPISLPQILLMRLRRVNPNHVIDSAVLAAHSGVRIRIADLERAYLRGANIELVTRAYIELHKRGEDDLSFDDLVEAEVGHRLDDLLQTR